METPITMPQQQTMPLGGKKSTAGAKFLLVMLVLLLAFLVFVYWLLTRPPVPAKAPETKGIESLFSIYGISKTDTLSDPNAVAVDKQGNLYVADTGKERILVFSSNGTFKSKIEHKPKPDQFVADNLYSPLGVAVGDDGRIYASSILSGVFIFKPDGKFEKHLPIPTAVQVTAHKGKIYLTTKTSVYVLSPKGDILQHIGSGGRGLGQFEYPNDIAVNAKGQIIVSDTQNMRLQVLSKKGKTLLYMGTPPKDMADSDRLFGLNTGMTLDDEGRIYIADAFHHAIRVFKANGDDLGEFGQQGTADGLLNYPSDITFLGGNRFAIADKWNDRVQVVRITPADVSGRSSRTSTFPIALIIGMLVLLLLIGAYLLRRYLANRGVGGSKEINNFS